VFEFLIATVSTATNLGGPAEIWASVVQDMGKLAAGDLGSWSKFLQVLMIDIVLAGDNAIVVGALAAGLPADQRRKVIIIGVVAALILRIIFALVVVQLMAVVGLIFLGGLLLIWVAWKMWRELRHVSGPSGGSPEIVGDEHSGLRPAKSFAGAVWAVAIADVSMSLDNVLAVAGASKGSNGIMIVGLVFAVALMGVAANIIAKYIERYRWIAYIGLAVIVYVAGKMIYDGWVDPAVGIGTLFG
jgi:YjbE family integral membrane protein